MKTCKAMGRKQPRMSWKWPPSERNPTRRDATSAKKKKTIQIHTTISDPVNGDRLISSTYLPSTSRSEKETSKVTSANRKEVNQTYVRFSGDDGSRLSCLTCPDKGMSRSTARLPVMAASIMYHFLCK